jgi:hypothetical protein
MTSKYDKFETFLSRNSSVKGLKTLMNSYAIKVARIDGYEPLYIVKNKPPADAGLKNYRFFDLNNGQGDVLWTRRKQ